MSVMHAIVHRRFGSPDVLQMDKVDRPTADDDHVLIRVHAASVNPLDWHLMTGTPYVTRLQAGMRRPKQLIAGTDVAGTVEAVGRNVTAFAPGDEVFGGAAGSFAEYACARATAIVAKPASLSFEQAAAVPVAALTALQALRDKGNLQPGQHVLINGAAGGVGTFAVQIAKALGAEVTGVCSAANVDMVRSIGADHVVDYTAADFASSGQRYDIMLDNVGNRSFADCRRVLSTRGVYVIVGGPKKGRVLGPLTRMLKAMAVFSLARQKAAPLMAQLNRPDDLRLLSDLLASGAVTPVIDRTFPLAETADAVRHIEGGHARGKIVITF